MPPTLLRSLVLAGVTFLLTVPASRASPVSNVTNPAPPASNATDSESPLSNVTETEPPVVDLGYAKYEGVSLPVGVNQFLGMRYAEPPTGGLRWREPQDPVEESSEVSSAENFGPICVGVPQDMATIDFPTSEDCLYVNVFSPSNATADSKLPVLFFIQGGGYATNSNANYNGTDIVEKSGHGLVMVNFNYRVGALGFLASEKIRADGALNVGLLDQRKALEWVQKNIHLFGGNPDHVVIHGVSAGGGSVAYHLAAYGGRDDGLFVGAIPQSPFFPLSRTVAESEFQFDRFVRDTGCSNATDELACLRNLPLSAIQPANDPSPLTNSTAKPNHYFLPVVDGDFSQEHMYKQFAEGRFVKVPTLVGGDTNEGDTFVKDNETDTQEGADAFLRKNWPNLTKEDIAAINKAFPNTPREKHSGYFGQASDVYGNMTFACGGLLMSSAVAEHLGPGQSWNYRYNLLEPWQADKGNGATHTSEIPAVFGPGFAGNETTALGTYNADMVPVLRDYIISFVKTLDPNTLKHEAAPTWNGFDEGHEERLLLELPVDEIRIEEVPDFQREACELLIGMSERTNQ